MADVTFCPFKEKRCFVFFVIKGFVLPFNGRNLYCYWAVREVGYSMTEVGRKLRIRQPTVSISAKRGEQIAKERGYYLAK